MREVGKDWLPTLTIPTPSDWDWARTMIDHMGHATGVFFTTATRDSASYLREHCIPRERVEKALEIATADGYSDIINVLSELLAGPE